MIDNGGFLAFRVKGVSDRETVVVLTPIRRFCTCLLSLLHRLVLVQPSGPQLFHASFPVNENRWIGSNKYCFGGITPAFFSKTV